MKWLNQVILSRTLSTQIIIGGDLSVQLSQVPGPVGECARGERSKDGWRADLVYGFATNWNLKVATSYHYAAKATIF